MSSRSSCGDILSCSQTSSTGSRRPSRPAAISTDASVTRRAKRSGRIVPSLPRPRPLASLSTAGGGRRRGRAPAARRGGSSTIRSIRSRASSTSSGGPSTRACCCRPSAHEISSRGDRVVGVEDVVAQLAVGAELALDVPRDLVGDPDLGGADRVAELPRGAAGVLARVEVGGALEVVLGLGRVRDLAADAREPEHAHVLALVRVADEVELPALEQQVVRVDLAQRRRVRLHRVVLELDPLAAVDRGVDLRQPRRRARRRRPTR